MAAPSRTPQTSGNKAQLHRYKRYYWIAAKSPSTPTGTDGYSCLTYTGKASKAIGGLCALKEADDITQEAIEKFEFLYGGKDPDTRSSGKMIPKFYMTIAGGAYALMRAFIGRDQGVSTVNSFEPEIEYPASGHILINSYDDRTNLLVGQTLFMNLKVHFDSIEGLKTTGESMIKVGFSSPSARVIMTDVAQGEMINVEFWRDNATTDINTNAPDGTLTTFVAGTGNGSYPTSTTPVPLALDSTNPNLTGWKDYLIDLRVNGAVVPLQGTGSATFSTSTITFAAAPADGKAILAIYICDPATYGMACFSGDANTQTVTDTEFPWHDYYGA